MNNVKIKKSGFIMLAMVIFIGVGLVVWKHASTLEANAALANQPEPVESIKMVLAKPFEHREETTSIGTIVALRSITLRNELPGTVRKVMLTPGQVVNAGSILVKLDVSVEQAELKAQQAHAALARATLNRMRKAFHNRAASEIEVDRAASELDVAMAQISRIKAIIARKTIRAPFKARVGLADVHRGQYLNEGTQLTTLQGVDNAVHVDFMVPQKVAAGLREGQQVDVFAYRLSSPKVATIVAHDARIDPATRNVMVRARIEGIANAFTPGSSVRIQIPIGEPRKVVAVPVSALRKGPEGDYVFVITQDGNGSARAHRRLVESGAMLGDEVVINSGLSVGEQIAASGSFKLREEALVAIANDAGADREER